MSVFTWAEGKSKEHFEEIIVKSNLKSSVEKANAEWLYFNKGNFSNHLFDVPSDALAVVGAYGHGMLKDMIMGSKMEMLQTMLPNNLLIVGPNCIKLDDTAL